MTRRSDSRTGRAATRRIARIAMLVVIAGAIAMPTKGHATSRSSLPASFTTYPLNTTPNDLKLGPDGRWWVPPFYGTTIDRLTTAGVDTPLPFGASMFQPRMTTGADGNIWMIDYDLSKPQTTIDKISPSGTLLAAYPAPTGLADIVGGPDGNVWFTSPYTEQIGRITPSGDTTFFPWPGNYPFSITAGPDGNLWVSDFVLGAVGRVTLSGVVTLFPVPQLDSQPSPFDITTGPDGNLWFTDQAGAIGRITPSGTLTQFVTPNGIAPSQLATGADGNIWFTDPGGVQVGRITTTGQVGVFDVSSAGQRPWSIAGGPDARIWLTLGALEGPPGASVAAFEPFTPTPSAPQIRNITTRYALPSGGGQTVITGYDVGFATKVLFGSTPATSFTSRGPGQLVATIPPHAAGAVDITVDTPYGTSVTTPPTDSTTGSHFYYQATDCGAVITKTTRLTSNIGPCYTAGLTVAADNVTLDLGGHGVVGFQDPRGELNGTVVGIDLPQRSGVTVENGTVSGFNAGVHIGGGSGNTVTHMSIHDNLGPDTITSQFGDGVMIEHGSSNNKILHNVINHNGIYDGIGVFDPGSDGNTIAYNTIENTVGTSDQGPVGEGIIVNGASGIAASTAIHSTVIQHNVVSNSASGGISNINEIGGTVAYNTITGSGATNSFGNGIGVQVGFNWTLGPTQMVVEHNQVNDSGIDGIRIGGPFGFFIGAAEGNTIAYNRVTGSGANPSVDSFECCPVVAYDLHDVDPTCGTNVWLDNTWSTAGFTPACTTTDGTGPSPTNATLPTIAAGKVTGPPATFPNAQVWKAFLQRGRS